VGAVWNGLRQDFTRRLGRALRDGLLFLGFAYFVNVFVLWWAPLASFDVLAMHLGLDPVEHEAVLRRLALGTLLEGGDKLMTTVALLSLALRSTWCAVAAAWSTHTGKGTAHVG
jgi:hypothetical protein